MAEVITINDAMRLAGNAHRLERAAGAGQDAAGKILLFTGVRIERFSDTKDPPRKGPGGKPSS